MPFQRLDASRGGSGHSGLGLAIAARVARNHGGGLQRLSGDGHDGCQDGGKVGGKDGRRFGIALLGRSRPAAAA
jgi:hypothetical protein